jgi:hypothetical protein
MTELIDYDLQQPGEIPPPPPSPPPHRRPVAVWIGAAALLVILGIAAYYFTRAPATAPSNAAPAAGKAQPDSALGRDGLNLTLPPLEMSDAFIRELVAKLSSHPRVAAWLATDGLVRNFTVVVVNIAEGHTPAPQLRRLRPAGQFQIITRGNDTLIDPRSYDRYTSLAEATASMDPAGTARLYGGVKPLIDQAYAELGYPDIPFDRMLERAIVQLLETPVVEDPIRVNPKGIGWVYADARLEGLTGAQRQLLRLGARNQRIVQESLRKVALALGIPAQRLP